MLTVKSRVYHKRERHCIEAKNQINVSTDEVDSYFESQDDKETISKQRQLINQLNSTIEQLEIEIKHLKSKIAQETEDFEIL